MQAKHPQQLARQQAVAHAQQQVTTWHAEQARAWEAAKCALPLRMPCSAAAKQILQCQPGSQAPHVRHVMRA